MRPYGRIVVLALVVAAIVAAALGTTRLSASPSNAVGVPVHDPIEDRRQLARAVVEAHANCEAARHLGAAILDEEAPRILLDLTELESALGGNPILHAALDERELPRLVLAVRLLNDVSYSLAEGAESARDKLGEVRLTSEDVRFLLAALHVRLDRAARGIRGSGVGHAPEHPWGVDAHAPDKLRQFRGMSFDEALRTFE